MKSELHYSWLLVTDVDHTLLGSVEAVERFLKEAADHPQFGYLLNSSRPLASIQKTLRLLGLPIRPLAIIGSMGTEIRVGEEQDRSWSDQFGHWDRRPFDDLMLELGLKPHEEEFQTPYKVSYAVRSEDIDRVRAAIRNLGRSCRVVFSSRRDLDILPPETGKGPATSYCLSRFSRKGTCSVGAGDSGNDIELLRATRYGIVVGNGDDELREAVDSTRTFMATQPFADGIIEGLNHWGAFHSQPSKVIPTA